MRFLEDVFNWFLSLGCRHECRCVVEENDRAAIFCTICEKKLTKWEAPGYWN